MPRNPPKEVEKKVIGPEVDCGDKSVIANLSVWSVYPSPSLNRTKGAVSDGTISCAQERADLSTDRWAWRSYL